MQSGIAFAFLKKKLRNGIWKILYHMTNRIGRRTEPPSISGSM